MKIDFYDVALLHRVPVLLQGLDDDKSTPWNEVPGLPAGKRRPELHEPFVCQCGADLKLRYFPDIVA